MPISAGNNGLGERIPIKVTGRPDTDNQGEGNDVTPGQRGIKRSPPDDDDGSDSDMRGGSCSHCYGGPDPAPRDRRGDSGDDDYKEDPFETYGMRQRRLGNKDPRYTATPLSPGGEERKSERPYWLPAHPDEQLKKCNVCQISAYGARCYCTSSSKSSSGSSTGSSDRSRFRYESLIKR